MPRTKQGQLPAYRLHTPSGRAVVTLPDGQGGRRDYYLGEWDSAENKTEYARLIAEWQACHRQLPLANHPDLTMAELMVRYLAHAEQYYRRPE